MTVLLILLAAGGLIAGAWGAIKSDVQAVALGVILVATAVLVQLLA